ncbi:cysteine proteinase [Ceratobasidium sp. AG-I]|nr:cysteine proteinase [Ceratobasidium sp. AG-I]
MSLLKWVGLGAGQNGTHASSTSAKNAQPLPSAPVAPPQPDNPALTTARWDHKRFGMENFGNTCYANSVLQALYYCDPFRQLLCDAPDRTYPTGPAAFTTAPPPPPQSAPAAKPRPAHGRRPSTGPDLPTPHAMSYMGGGGAAFVATAFISPPGGTPHKTTSAPTPAPIVNVGPVIPAAPPTLFSALRSLFIHIAANPADKGTVSPRAFVEKLKKENELFRSNMHQDAHEFLNYLLNSVVEDLTEELKAGPPEDLSKSVASTSSGISRGTSSSYSNPNLTLVHDLFEGTLTSETRCLTCETVSSRDESFLDLSIDIERNSSVTACLRQFSASEMLCQKNKFFCDSCCGLQEAEKRMKIKKLPNVLALHLKRFKYQEDVQRYIKLSYRVAFPFELRLFNTVDDAQDPDRLYELFAIVVHVGSGPHHGHYITIAKQRGQWLMFDDDVVEPIRESEIPKYFGDSPAGSGYVLFYQAVNIDLQALGVKSPPSPQTATVIPQQSIPPVVVDAPTSPIVEDTAEGRVSPDLSESGTIGTPSPSTPTRSHPPSSPVISKLDAPSTAPPSAPGSGFTNPIRSKPSHLALGGSGSISAQDSTNTSVNGSNGDASHDASSKEKESRSSSLSSSWFSMKWGNKKKSKDTPGSSRKPTLDDSRAPIIDIRRPSAPAMMETPPLMTPADGSPRLHDEPEQSPHPDGLFDLGRATDDPMSARQTTSIRTPRPDP